MKMPNGEITQIHIIGGPGSGKSYAAKKLSACLKIPFFDLDDLKWDKKSNEYGLRTPINIRDRKLKNILKRKKWIIEGVYYDWVQESFAQANIIIIINPKKYIRDWRIIKRFILRKFGLVKSKKESFKNLFQLIKWNHQYNENELAKATESIKKYKDKTKYFNKADEAISYILYSKS
jgi:adenylate kinase family enzyme